jgi:hypothetical protein
MRLSRLFFATLLVSSCLWAQEDPTQKETLRLQALADKERASLNAENARHEEWKRQHQVRLSQMRKEIAQLQKQSDSLKVIASKTPAPIKPTAIAPPAGSLAEAKRKAFAAELATLVESLLPRVSEELDPDSRTRALQELSKGLRNGSISPEDGIGQLFDQFSELIDEGSRIRSEAGSYTSKSGQILRGTYIHAGGLLNAFVDREGSFAAMRHRGEPTWTEISDAPTLGALAQSAKVLTGQEKGLIHLPLGEAK